MGQDRREDPLGSHYFALEINHTQVAHFRELSGLRSTSDVYEIREGGLNGFTHKRPGPARFSNATLRYATSTSQALLAWRDRYLRDGFQDQVTDAGAVVVYDAAGREVRRYSFTRAWPVSWEGPELDAGRSGIAIETLEIAFDGLTVT